MKMKKVNIGIGLAGSKFAEKMDGETIIINISSEELDVTGDSVKPENKIHLGNHIGGAGKDRIAGLHIFAETENNLDIVNGIYDKIKASGAQMVTVAFSTGGGTGSGIGPVVYQLLRSKLAADGIVLIVGFALLPSMEEGLFSFTNTLLCFNDIEKSIAKGGRYVLVKNDIKADKLVDCRKAVNARTVKIFESYVDGKSTSGDGVLDYADRIRGLEQTGIHGFEVINDNNISVSPMITPGSSLVKMICADIPESAADDIEHTLSSANVIDSKYGYRTTTDGVIAYHGFKNLPKVILTYRTRFDELKALNESTDIDTGDNAFKDIEADILNYHVGGRDGIFIDSKENDEDIMKDFLSF